jgi:hypothetical protein
MLRCETRNSGTVSEALITKVSQPLIDAEVGGKYSVDGEIVQAWVAAAFIARVRKILLWRSLN